MKTSAALALAALACACAAPAPIDSGGPRIGVVVVHGKWSNPNAQTLGFTRAMQRAGFLTDAPEMPWSGRRSYDIGVAGMVAEIDAAVARLKNRGAEKVVVAGHSLGAVAAMRYAGERRVDALIALAPGHIPEHPRFIETVAGSLRKAKAMPAGEPGWFDDPNVGGAKPMHMKAGVYVDYFDSAGPMNFRNNVAALRPGTSVLWVVGNREDARLKEVDRTAFAALARDPAPKYVEVAAGHLDTPDAAGEVCAQWIREIAGETKRKEAP